MLIFSSLTRLEGHQENSQTWSTLMVPDWSFGGSDHLYYQILHHESTLYVILELYANFQLPGINRSMSRKHSYLDDVDGS